MTLSDLGGLIGLIAGLFVLYDRFCKRRPIASLTVRDDDGRRLVCVRIKNPTDHDMLMRGAYIRPNIYFLLPDDEIETVLENTTGVQDEQFILKPNQSRELIVAPRFKNGMAMDMTGNRSVVFWIKWRRAHTRWGVPRMPVPVRTNTRFIRRLAGVE